jgi:hypothetical protein
MARHPHAQQTVGVCEHARMCADGLPGHELTFMRLRLAGAARRGWVDAVVRRVTHDGRLELEPWNGGAPFTVWHHADLTATLPVGSPVAVHAEYGVLASGSARISVAAG